MNKFFFNGNIDSETALKLMEKEYALNPDMKKTTIHYYIETLSKVPSRKVEAINLAKNNFEEILNTGINENYSYRYANIIADGVYKVSDSLKTLVAQKYHTGFAAINRKLELLNRYSISKPDTAINLYENIKKDFPKISMGQKRFMIVELLAAYAQKFDFVNLNNTFDSLLKIDKSEQVFIMVADKFNDVAWSISKTNKDLEQAKIIIEKSIIAHKNYDSLSTFYGNALDTYAGILSKLGDKKGAIINQKKAVYLKNNIFPDVNQQLIQYLIDDKQFKEARSKAEEFMIGNESSPKIDSLYKIAYMVTSDSEKGFENASAKIKEKADGENTKFLKQKLINVDAPDFELKDLNGKIVKLSDFRGSIVVLDFWATWCGPCIGSFPAMKKVMNELKDKSVKFLFIDTMESEELDNKNEKVKKILSSKKVSDFHVLLDEIKDLSYKVTTAYNVPSIPAKFIIDNNGKIRYRSTGFSTDENLIKELKTVVKLISE
jgi:peroxiredoxin